MKHLQSFGTKTGVKIFVMWWSSWQQQTKINVERIKFNVGIRGIIVRVPCPLATSHIWYWATNNSNDILPNQEKMANNIDEEMLEYFLKEYNWRSKNEKIFVLCFWLNDEEILTGNITRYGWISSHMALFEQRNRIIKYVMRPNKLNKEKRILNFDFNCWHCFRLIPNDLYVS